MPAEHDEFDLDVRLHGMPLGQSLQAETHEEACNTLRSFCECDDTSHETCDGLAVTCNTCHATCGGEGGTFCEETCGEVQTCPTCDICHTQGCFTHGCATNETCDQQICFEGATSPPCGEEEETDETCGCQPGPGEPPDDPV